MVYRQNEKKTVTESKKVMQVMKKCPVCDRRIFDKITPTSGLIEMKCPHCRKVVTVNLALRRCSSSSAYNYN